MEFDQLASALVGGVIGALVTLVSAYWAPRKLEEWRSEREERRLNGPRKELLLSLLEDNYDWRSLRVLSRATGSTDEECKRLLIEIGARGSTAEGEEESWGLISKNPFNER